MSQIKPRVIFIIVSLYVLAAFTWWTLAHIRAHTEIAALKKQNIIEKVKEAKLLIENKNLVGQHQMDSFIQSSYPDLNIEYYHTKHNFNIIPKKDAIAEHDLYLRRKTWQYVGEGLVMMVLLFWGMLVIYRTFSKNIRLNKQQNNFLLSITHELKTPIASVKLYIETLLKRDLDKEKTTTILKNSLLDMKRLQILVENLLLSAQIESKKFDLSLLENNLSELLNQIIDKYATPRGIEGRLINKIQDEIYVDCDKMAIEMLLTNLLDNAIKYSPTNSPIHIELSQSENKTVLELKDEGEGISAADKKVVFRKFFRAGDENTRKSKGSGLGLFIIKNIVQLHNAQIEILDNSPKGTIFKIIFNKI
jgi:signal transduction histidine kinase